MALSLQRLVFVFFFLVEIRSTSRANLVFALIAVKPELLELFLALVAYQDVFKLKKFEAVVLIALQKFGLILQNIAINAPMKAAFFA